MSATLPDQHAASFQFSDAGHDPRVEIVVGGVAAAIFFLGFVGWAAFAPMDAASSAPGVVVVSGHRQAVQSRDPGVVSAVDVREGDRVGAGQVLVEFAPAEARAEEAALSARVVGLQVHLARLEAEQAASPTIAAPAEFASMAPEQRPLAAQALATEARALRAAYAEDAARHALWRQHATEANQQIDGYRQQLAANQRQHAINDQELAGMQALAARGYAPITRVLALQHTAASLDGDAGAQNAEIARLRSVAGETQLQILQGDSDKAQQVSEDVRRTEADLETAVPQLQAAREHLEHTRIRAPVSGSVVGLTVNAVSGVVVPGEKLMEIVPDKLPLVIEAQVDPRDAGALKIGQATQVRFPGLHSRALPIIHGVLSRVAPDSLLDEHTGRAYFTVDVTVPTNEFARVGDLGAAVLKPGMPAEVVVPTRKRTALQYWLEPLTQTWWRALREP